MYREKWRRRCLTLLWVDLFGIYFGGESGSISALEAGGGARYQKCFLVFFRYFGSD